MSGEKGRQSQDLSNFIDEHLQELKWFSYGVGASAMLILVWKLKVTKKFVAVSQIPSQFITKSYTLQGHVRHITDSGVLKIEHLPIVEIRWIPNVFQYFKLWPKTKDDSQHLSIVPAGVDLTPDAVLWLKLHASGKHAWFQIFARDQQHLLCDIRIRKGYVGRVSVSQALIQEGLAKVTDFMTPPTSEYFHLYLRQLIALETTAANKNRGIWKEEDGSSWWRRTLTSSRLYSWCSEGWKRLARRK